MHFPNNIENMKLFFVGIKGTGMAALAEICTYRGAIIDGSDVEDKFYTDDVLKTLGITPKLFNTQNITKNIDLIIYSAAYNIETHEELIQAKKLGIPLMLYTEALGKISESTYSCAIAGVHGKTSTTGITGTLVKALNLPSQVLAGSIISSFGDSTLEQGSCTLNQGKDFFIAETCEYKRHFMSFQAKKIIMTSVESDHQDYFPTFEDIQRAFIDFALLLPKGGELIYCADDKGARDTATIIKEKRSDIVLTPYGLTATGDYKITLGEVKNGKQFFNLECFKDFIDGFYLTVPGKHNVLNSAASCALVMSLLKESQTSLLKNEIYEKLKEGFANFRGSRRRAEIIDSIAYKGKNVLIMDDYAHHPTALKTTIQGLKDFYKDYHIIVDFMSHTYSRTASLLDGFASSFDAADEVILHDIYASAREQFDGNIDGMVLAEKTQTYHSTVQYFKNVEEALPHLMHRISQIKKDVLFVTMGAGDNWKLGKLLQKELTI